MGPLAEQNHEPVLDLKFDVSHNPECPVKNNGRRLSSSVRFLDCPMYRETISRHDLSQKEIDDTWFSGEEYQYIKTVNTVTVRMMAGERPLLDPEIYCSRGLECRTPTGWENRVRNKTLVRRAVLKVQNEQKSEGNLDPAMIGQVSYGVSYRARQEARERAQYDQAVAENQGDEDTTLHEDDDHLVEDLTYFSFFSV